MTAALDASPSRIPVLARRLRQRTNDRCCSSCANGWAARPCQYIDVERTATTPERFLRAVTAVSPFPVVDTSRRRAARRAGGVRRHAGLVRARRGRRRASRRRYFLDEFLELRTFESFPGLRRVLHECVDALAASGNRFVLTSRYSRARCGCCAIDRRASK